MFHDRRSLSYHFRLTQYKIVIDNKWSPFLHNILQRFEICLSSKTEFIHIDYKIMPLVHINLGIILFKRLNQFFTSL